MALGVEGTESGMGVYRGMGWLPLRLRRQVHLFSCVFEIMRGQSPSSFIGGFEFVSGGGGGGADCDLCTPI